MPTERKRALGNPGKRALPDRTVGNLAAVPAVSSEPHDLDPHAAFDSVMAGGRQWLAQTDSTALALLRESLEERQALREVVIATQSETARKALRDLDKQVIGQLSLLGFDPAARSRLGLAEVKAASTLEKLRQSRG